MEFSFAGGENPSGPELLRRVEIVLQRDKAARQRETKARLEQLSPEHRADRRAARAILSRLMQDARTGQYGGWAAYKAAKRVAQHRGLLSRCPINPNIRKAA